MCSGMSFIKLLVYTRMEGKDSQKKRLEAIFQVASFAPIFKTNPKHCINKFADLTPYISYKDLIKNRLYIRGCPIGSKSCSDNGQRDIIAEYGSIDELLNDGWQLDSNFNLQESKSLSI